METTMYALRVLSKGKLADITRGFSLGGSTFSIYLRPKSATMERDAVVRCRLICDREAGDLPVPLNDWTPAAIAELPPNAVSLDDYDVWWGAGNTTNH